jgi:hypothetical protein
MRDKCKDAVASCELRAKEGFRPFSRNSQLAASSPLSSASPRETFSYELSVYINAPSIRPPSWQAVAGFHRVLLRALGALAVMLFRISHFCPMPHPQKWGILGHSGASKSNDECGMMNAEWNPEIKADSNFEFLFIIQHSAFTIGCAMDISLKSPIIIHSRSSYAQGGAVQCLMY